MEQGRAGPIRVLDPQQWRRFQAAAAVAAEQDEAGRRDPDAVDYVRLAGAVAEMVLILGDGLWRLRGLARLRGRTRRARWAKEQDRWTIPLDGMEKALHRYEALLRDRIMPRFPGRGYDGERMMGLLASMWLGAQDAFEKAEGRAPNERVRSELLLASLVYLAQYAQDVKASGGKSGNPKKSPGNH